MEIVEILKHLPPLHYSLGRVSRNFYRSIERAHKNVSYWRSRPDAPYKPLSSEAAYVIYYNMRFNIQKYGQPAAENLFYDRRFISPAGFAEAFPVVWNSLPAGSNNITPRRPGQPKSLTRWVIMIVYSLIGKLIRCGKNPAIIAPFAKTVSSYIRSARIVDLLEYTPSTFLPDVIAGLKKFRSREIYR